MLKKSLKFLLFSGVGLLVSGLVLWAAGSVVANRQIEEMDAIAINTIKQSPKLQENQSAQQLQALTKKLGFLIISDSSNDTLDPDKKRDADDLYPFLSEYFTAQSAKMQGPLDPIPVELQTYLANNSEILSDIQDHLNTNAQPQWDFDCLYRFLSILNGAPTPICLPATDR